MSVTRGFVITVVSALVFAFFGGLAGAALGWAAPDYYRIVFAIQSEVSFNSVQLGVGLGITQGFGAGLITGLAIVLIVAWYNRRTEPKVDSGRSA
jgi:MFS family permease